MNDRLQPGDHLIKATRPNRYTGNRGAETEVFTTTGQSIYEICCVSIVVVKIGNRLWLEAQRKENWNGRIELHPLDSFDTLEQEGEP